jgi:hypothetical protein
MDNEGSGNGSGRIKLDTEELATAPVFAGGRYVVVTREGRVTGLQIP